MSSRQKKGRSFELWCRDWLRKNGWLAEAAGKKAMKIGGKIIFRGNDFFGVFDVIAISPKGKIKFIQATTHSGLGKKEKEILNIFSGVEFGPDISIEIWVKRKGGDICIQKKVNNHFQEIGIIKRGKLYELHQTD